MHINCIEGLEEVKCMGAGNCLFFSWKRDSMHWDFLAKKQQKMGIGLRFEQDSY